MKKFKGMYTVKKINNFAMIPSISHFNLEYSIKVPAHSLLLSFKTKLSKINDFLNISFLMKKYFCTQN
jgi:hypothetical protein